MAGPSHSASSKRTPPKHNLVSEQAWLHDLGELLKNAKSRFADISWGNGKETVYAHKAIVYARASGEAGPALPCTLCLTFLLTLMVS